MAKFETDSKTLCFMNPESGRKTIAAVLSRVNVPKEDAQIIAEIMLDADLRGVDTHGIRTLPIYTKRFINGGLNPNPKMTVDGAGAVARMDGDNGLGHVVGYRAMKLAMERAKQFGIGLVSVRNSNHFGAAAYFSMLAQKEGFIGVSMANAQARMAPTGGITPCYGSNPWSVAFPYREGEIPVVLDMANCVVANSNILMARELGVKIPVGWGMTAEGEDTDDPNLAVLPLPFGGYKGYAIAMAVEVLAGVLSGAAYGPAVGSYSDMHKGQDVGQMFMAIDMEHLMDRETYYLRFHDFTGSLKASKLAKGCQEILLPGEKEFRNKEQRLQTGIPIDAKYVELINWLCREVGASDTLQVWKADETTG